MKMHSIKFKDPLISRAQPVTVIVPLIEETLRAVGIHPVREQILDRFMAGHPRVAVVHGGEDHPPYLGMKEMTRRLIRAIWAGQALPFEVSQAVACEQLAQATDGMHYGLLSRNFCTTNLATQMESQGYDAAVLVGVCDKMMVGDLRALVETDLARQRRRARPVFAMLIPSFVNREALMTEEDGRRFEPLRSRLSDAERLELDGLLHRPMKPNVYAALKTLLDLCFHRRIIQESEKDDLEYLLARCAVSPGANCSASESSMVHRLMLASFGIVPRRMEIAVCPPPGEHIVEAVNRLLLAIQKRERRVSVSSLVRANLGNAASVWSATGGHSGWLLHLTYLADAVGKKLSLADITRKANTVPQILAIPETSGNSVYSMALETENGGNSGIDTVMRTLAEKRLIEDRAPTLDGSWMQRIMDARSANGNFLHSTMTPVYESCGSRGVQGNICLGGISRLGSQGRHDIESYDRKIYLAVYYLGARELQSDLIAFDGVLERLKRKVSREDMYYTWMVNWQSQTTNGATAEVAQWNKHKLWDYLVVHRLLRIMVVVAGAGPHASGMPELHLTGSSSVPLGALSVLVTDGRVCHEHEGISIAHVVPEAIDGGGLAAIRTGDWIYLDLRKGDLQVVRQLNKNGAYRAISAKDLLNRPDRKRHIHEIEKRRMDFLPSFRVALDNISSAETGVSPSRRTN